MGNDLWSDNPEERLAAARDPEVAAGWPQRIGETAPMKPWPFGMPCPINPFVLFLGASPGNAPDPRDTCLNTSKGYPLPTAGKPHCGLYYRDGTGYWERIRLAGTIIVQGHSPRMRGDDALALIGQLNLGTGMFGQAKNAALEPAYCRWVPDVVMDHLKPRYLILLGLASKLMRSSEFDPLRRLSIDWSKPEMEPPFQAYSAKQYQFRAWAREKPDGKTMTVVLWPQHPSRPPMKDLEIWKESAREFVQYFCS
jgi:hypothetical protein